MTWTKPILIGTTAILIAGGVFGVSYWIATRGLPPAAQPPPAAPAAVERTGAGGLERVGMPASPNSAPDTGSVPSPITHLPLDEVFVIEPTFDNDDVIEGKVTSLAERQKPTSIPKPTGEIQIIPQPTVGTGGGAAVPRVEGSADPDKDGLTNDQELQQGTDPNKADTDGDGLSDGDEVRRYRTDPKLKDTDGDGLTDGEEVNTYKTDPLNPDTDGDTYKDGAEVKAGYNPRGPGKL